MRTFTRIFKWLYTQSLKLYPVEFRTNFIDEMQAVFAQAIAEQSGKSFSKTLAYCLREIVDLPGSLLHQHWLVIKEGRTPMNTLAESHGIQREPRQPGTWGAAFLAGLPHLLMGSLIGVGKLGIFDIDQISPSGSAIIGVGLAFLVIGMLLYAWRRGWPLWSASWYLYGTWVVLAIIGLGIERLDIEGSWRFTNAMFIGWILLCVIGYFIILARSRMHGLLSVAFLFPLLGVMFLEFIPNPIEGRLAIGLGLLTASTVAGIVRKGDFQAGLRFVLGVNILAGLCLAYVGEYQIKDLPTGIPAHIPRFGNFLELLALYSLFGLGIIALPFILRGLWNVGTRKFS